MPLHAYYEGAHRVSVDGVPQRVFQKRSPELVAQLAMLELAAAVGSELELLDVPGFKFAPVEKAPEELPAARGALPVPKAEGKAAKAYYGGGVRKVIAWVPCRLVRYSPRHELKHWAGPAPMDGHAERLAEFAAALEEKYSEAAEPLPLAA